MKGSFKNILIYFTKGDVFLILGIIVAAVFLFSFSNHAGIIGNHVVVDVEGKRAMELPLNKNVVTSVEGPLGKTIIKINEGSVSVIDSDCPNHYCVHMGKIRLSGEIIVCIPNRVVVKVTGGGNSFDGVTQ